VTASSGARPGLTRFALLLQYDGGPFHGWQLQKEEPTVQGALEAVLTRITGERRVVVGSGRTDRGVHASGQVASVDLPPPWDAPRLRRALNALLPREIWVEEVRRVAPDFHPRYDAVRRSYLYRVGIHPRARSPFLRGSCWPLDGNPPDPELLEEGARRIPGERSFRSFAKAGQPERGERCRVDSAGWSPWPGPAPGHAAEPGGPPLGTCFQITADRYLHHMVRYLVGTLVAVARGERPMEELEELLEDPGTGLVTSPPAPPEGLFLSRVEYPPEVWNPGCGTEDVDRGEPHLDPAPEPRGGPPPPHP
jgi:tRNA pseudouridine38-40 synthase